MPLTEREFVPMALGSTYYRIASRGLSPHLWLLGSVVPLWLIGALVGLVSRKCSTRACGSGNTSPCCALSCSFLCLLFLLLLFAKDRLQKNCLSSLTPTFMVISPPVLFPKTELVKCLSDVRPFLGTETQQSLILSTD